MLEPIATAAPSPSSPPLAAAPPVPFAPEPGPPSDGARASLEALAKLVREANRHFGEETASKQALDYLFDSLGSLVPYDRIGLALLDGDGTHLRLRWVRSRAPVNYGAEGYRAPLRNSSLQNVLDSGQPRIIDDLARYLAEHPDSESTRRLIQDGVRSNLTLPLRTGRGPLGVLFFSSFEPRSYHEEHARILADIAEELAVVVERARVGEHLAAAESRQASLAKTFNDLRAPLRALQVCVEGALGADWFAQLPSPARDTFRLVQRQADILAAVLQEMTRRRLQVSPPLLLRPEPVRLPDFVAEVSAHARELATRKGIYFSSHVGPSLPLEAKFDGPRLRQALDVLVGNAVKYSAPKTNVSFSVLHEENRLIFIVRDEGCGIEPESLPTVFYDTLPVREEREDGERGLSFVKNVVEQSGGRVLVDTISGAGCTFTFWIPTFP